MAFGSPTSWWASSAPRRAYTQLRDILCEARDGLRGGAREAVEDEAVVRDGVDRLDGAHDDALVALVGA